MPSELSIHSKRVMLASGLQDASILIDNGKITSIIEGKADKTMARTLVHAGDSVVMPGLIDCHVHINEPGRSYWEGFETATQAAAAGGVTSLVDMPLNSTPVTTSVNNLRKKAEAARGKLFVNCAFWGGIVPGNSSELEALLKAGVPGFKVFLTHSGIEDFPNTSLKELEKIAPVLAKYNVPLLVHAELESANPAIRELEKDPCSYPAYLHSRPRSWEDQAIKAMIDLCEKHRLRVHIVHLSSSDSIEQIRVARNKNLPLSVETCPHYLYFNAEKIPDADTRFKCAPPIREKENNDQLWKALEEGLIDFIVTDHSPAPPEIKEQLSGNLKDAWGGIASLQFSLPVMWTLCLQHKIPLQQISQWMSTRIADFMGWKNKGRIEIGADADLVIWSPEKKIKVSKNLIRFKHKITPYEGELLSGLIEKTYVGGNLVYDRGSFVSSPSGKIILNSHAF